jgi:predicted ATP-binding protein involved in virulence
MRIRELKLVNYRAFADPPPFKFSDRFTVVAGINGRGKTALLDGLALLSSRFLPLISAAPSSHRRISPSEVHDDADKTQLTMKVNCAGTPVEYGITYEPENRKLTRTNLPMVLKQAIRFAYGDPNRADDAAPLVVYYTTDRAGYRLPKKLPHDVPRGQAAAYAGALFNRTVNFRDFMVRYRNAIIVDEERRQNPDYLGDPAVGAIAEAIATFLGGFGNLRVQENPLRLLVNKERISLDLTQLSDGERSFLALVCDLGRRLALANPALNNPLQGAGVVLIDELELHLHPKWQREIVEKLRNTFPNIQFIATTHSPFIIQSLRPGELINLDPEEFVEYADKSVEDIAENVMGVKLPQKSERFRAMVETAETYFRLVRETKPQSEEQRNRLRERLDELSEPFSDDPAYVALLRIERETSLGG